MANSLVEATVFLGSAVVTVPIFKRLGLGSVLGYLAAGMLIGPYAFGLIDEVEEILHFAELGVVFLLFIIGLELQPSRLWEMRKSVFGLGGLQVGTTALILAGSGIAFGLSFKAATIAGLALSLSSTAFVLQILAEKNQLAAPHGKAGFGILLFQDLIVIPIMAVMPLLADEGGGNAVPAWPTIAKVVLVFVVVILMAKYLMRPVFKLVAGVRSHEIFTAMALLIVIGTALVMQAIGLSMALGAFLAGVLLADSEYRHALEADIEPFKGLLLGLFFIAVGMSADLNLLLQKFPLIIALVIGLMTVKGFILFLLGKWFKLSGPSSGALATTLPQGGEFAFVLFGVATGFSVLDKNTADLLILVVTVSMILTPLLVLANEQICKGKPSDDADKPFDDLTGSEGDIIIAGFGRFGQIISRVLTAKKIPFTALEVNPQQVDFVRKFGNKIHYGDACRLDTLRAAGLENAKVLVIAVDKPETSMKIVEAVQTNFPHVRIYARAYDRLHAYRLMDKGIQEIERETFHSSLQMACSVLQGLGYTYSAALQATETFRNHDLKTLRESYQYHGDLNALTDRAKRAAKELEALFNQEAG